MKKNRFALAVMMAAAGAVVASDRSDSILYMQNSGVIGTVGGGGLGISSGNINSGGGTSTGTSKRGFASMDPARVREIAAEGGRAAHEIGTAHEFTTETARAAGRLRHKKATTSGAGATS